MTVQVAEISLSPPNAFGGLKKAPISPYLWGTICGVRFQTRAEHECNVPSFSEVFTCAVPSHSTHTLCEIHISSEEEEEDIELGHIEFRLPEAFWSNGDIWIEMPMLRTPQAVRAVFKAHFTRVAEETRGDWTKKSGASTLRLSGTFRQRSEPSVEVDGDGDEDGLEAPGEELPAIIRMEDLMGSDSHLISRDEFICIEFLEGRGFYSTVMEHPCEPFIIYTLDGVASRTDTAKTYDGCCRWKDEHDCLVVEDVSAELVLHAWDDQSYWNDVDFVGAVHLPVGQFRNYRQETPYEGWLRFGCGQQTSSAAINVRIYFTNSCPSAEKRKHCLVSKSESKSKRSGASAFHLIRSVESTRPAPQGEVLRTFEDCVRIILLPLDHIQDCITSPRITAESLPEQQKRLISHITEAFGVSPKESAAIVFRIVAECASMEERKRRVATSLFQRVATRPSHPFYSEEAFQTQEGWEKWMANEKFEVNRLLKRLALSVPPFSGSVKITVVSASNLKSKGPFGGKSNPVVHLQLAGATQMYRTNTLRKTSFPEWNQAFEFEVSTLKEVIEVSVWSENGVGSDRFLGQAELSVSDVGQGGEKEIELQLLPRSPKSHVRGSILLHAALKTSELLEWSEEGEVSQDFLRRVSTHFGVIAEDGGEAVFKPKEGEKPKVKKLVGEVQGSITRSLKVRPRLTVDVIAARSLEAADFGGTSDPYCILVLEGKQSQTRAIPKTLNPEWGERFPFDVCVVASSLSITVYDQDWGSYDDFLGKIEIPLLSIPHMESCHSNEGDNEEKASTTYIVDAWLPLLSKEGRVPLESLGDLRLRLELVLPKHVTTVSDSMSSGAFLRSGRLQQHHFRFRVLLNTLFSQELRKEGVITKLSEQSQWILDEYATRFGVGLMFQFMMHFDLIVKSWFGVGIDYKFLNEFCGAMMLAMDEELERTKYTDGVFSHALVTFLELVEGSLGEYASHFPPDRQHSGVSLLLDTIQLVLGSDPEACSRIAENAIRGAKLKWYQRFVVAHSASEALGELHAPEVSQLSDGTVLKHDASGPTAAALVATLDEVTKMLAADQTYYEAEFSRFSLVKLTATTMLGLLQADVSRVCLQQKTGVQPVDTNVFVLHNRMARFLSDLTATYSLEESVVPAASIMPQFLPVLVKYIRQTALSLVDWCDEACRLDDWAPVNMTMGIMHSTSCHDLIVALAQATGVFRDLDFKFLCDDERSKLSGEFCRLIGQTAKRYVRKLMPTEVESIAPSKRAMESMMTSLDPEERNELGMVLMTDAHCVRVNDMHHLKAKLFEVFADIEEKVFQVETSEETEEAIRDCFLSVSNSQTTFVNKMVMGIVAASRHYVTQIVFEYLSDDDAPDLENCTLRDSTDACEGPSVHVSCSNPGESESGCPGDTQGQTNEAKTDDGPRNGCSRSGRNSKDTLRAQDLVSRLGATESLVSYFNEALGVAADNTYNPVLKMVLRATWKAFMLVLEDTILPESSCGTSANSKTAACVRGLYFFVQDYFAAGGVHEKTLARLSSGLVILIDRYNLPAPELIQKHEILTSILCDHKETEESCEDEATNFNFMAREALHVLGLLRRRKAQGDRAAVEYVASLQKRKGIKESASVPGRDAAGRPESESLGTLRIRGSRKSSLPHRHPLSLSQPHRPPLRRSESQRGKGWGAKLFKRFGKKSEMSPIGEERLGPVDPTAKDAGSDSDDDIDHVMEDPPTPSDPSHATIGTSSAAASAAQALSKFARTNTTAMMKGALQPFLAPKDTLRKYACSYGHIYGHLAVEPEKLTFTGMVVHHRIEIPFNVLATVTVIIKMKSLHNGIRFTLMDGQEYAFIGFLVSAKRVRNFIREQAAKIGAITNFVTA